jgi:predicted  nucleic acid-binding Zn-ribbon protein
MDSMVHRFQEPDQHSTVRDVARNISNGNADIEQQFVEITAAKAIRIREKLESDTYGRLDATLQTVRVCRMAGYQFIKDTNLEALQEEVQYVLRLPLAVPLIAALEAELPTYKKNC